MTLTDGSRRIGWKIEGEGITRSQIVLVLVLEFMSPIEDEEENDLVAYRFSFAPCVPFCGDSTSDSHSSFLLCFDSSRVKLGSC